MTSDDEEGEHDDAGLDDGIVALGDGADQDLADAGPVEDELDRDRAGERREQAQAEAGRDRQQRVAQAVAVDDARFSRAPLARAVRT